MKLRMKASIRTLVIPILSVAASGCGGDDENQGGGPESGGQATTLSASVSSAVGLVAVDSQSGGSSVVVNGRSVENASYLAAGVGDSSSPLYKILSDGSVSSALAVSQGKYSFGGAPMIQTIAVSPAGDIYLHFERSFMYKEPPECNNNGGGGGEDGEEPPPPNPECEIDFHDMSSGYQCQLFKINGESVECIDNEHWIQSWRQDAKSLFQFDADSNLYYPGTLPNRSDTVVYRRSRDGSSLTEVINANICVQDYLVTDNGGVFYTGAPCGNNGGGEGGFFRYVAPGNTRVTEIARNWWNFVYEPVEGVTTDKVVFFGPDPRSSSTASWDNACLFEFDPNVTTGTTDATTELITCGNNIWDWINMRREIDVTDFGTGYTSGNSSPTAAWKTEFASRCESSGQTFAGGGSQISAIKQTSTGDIYVIGNLRVKKEGEISCNIDVKGSHCKINGVPYLEDAEYDTAAECSTAGGSWIEDEGWCDGGTGGETHDACLTGGGTWRYNSVWYSAASDLCTSASSNIVTDIWSEDVTATSGTEGTAKFSVGWLNCNVADGGDWTEEYKAMAKVNKTTKALEMLSTTEEQAVSLWLINDVPYYSTFDTTTGKYNLKTFSPTAGTNSTMATDFEAYNLTEGTDTGTLFYDGLDFSTNSYSFGTIGTVSPFARSATTGLTGKVKTILIF